MAYKFLTSDNIIPLKLVVSIYGIILLVRQIWVVEF